MYVVVDKILKTCQQKVKLLGALSCFMQNAVVTDGVGNIMLWNRAFLLSCALGR